jgi:hypothetical protein
MNTEFLQELHLRPERIVRDLDICIGLAKTYQQRSADTTEGVTIAQSVSATYFRRAAANALLLGRYADATELFLEATFVYRDLGLPYSVVVAALSSEGRGVTEQLTYSWLGAHNHHEITESAVPQLAYVVLAQLTSAKSRQTTIKQLASVRRDLDPYRLRPLGALGISVGTFLDLFDSLVPEIGQSKIDLSEAISPFFSAYNAAIRHTIQNHYHWERLALPFHPADPDIYGVLTLTNSALQMHRDVTLQRFIEKAAIARESKYLLSTILDGIADHQQDNHFRM